MTIKYVQGNILESDAQAVAIPVNAVGVAGAGLALAAARRWPYWAESYKAACATGRHRAGRGCGIAPQPGCRSGVDHLGGHQRSLAGKVHAAWRQDSGCRTWQLPCATIASGPWRCPPWAAAWEVCPGTMCDALIWEYLEGSTCDIRVYTPPLRVIVAGSRTITDYRLVVQAIQESGFTIREIISGGARGVDQLGLRYARGHKIPTAVFPANWKRDGRAAGFIRNEKMAEVAHALIAVWDGKSKGTKHMIDLARKLDLTVHVHQVNSLPGE